MFKVLLYLRVLLTILLTGIVLYYLYLWMLRILGKKKNEVLGNQVELTNVIVKEFEEDSGEMKEIVLEDDEESEEHFHQKQKLVDSNAQKSEMHQQHNDYQEADDEGTENRKEQPTSQLVDIQEKKHILESATQESNKIETPSYSAGKEDSGEKDGNGRGIGEEKTVGEMSGVGQKEGENHDASKYEQLFDEFVNTDVEVEIPKETGNGRDITKGLSRDDIVRDKFEKHIEKLRYEISILKQRSDLLGYEKKLVEGLTLIPNDTDFQRQLSDLYFQQGKYKKAQSLLKKILIDFPEDHYTLWQVGEIAMAEGNSEDAYLYLQQAYMLCDDNPKYCFSLAQWYYDHDALEQSLPLMEKMVKLRPRNIDYLVSLSHVHFKMGNKDLAKQAMLRALELDPMNVTLKNYLKAL